MAPTALIDPIQDIWSIESGPVRSGVLFDIRCGIAGDAQPYAQPWVKEIKFTRNEN